MAWTNVVAVVMKVLCADVSEQYRIDQHRREDDRYEHGTFSVSEASLATRMISVTLEH